MDAQVEQSLCCMHISHCWFCFGAAQKCYLQKYGTLLDHLSQRLIGEIIGYSWSVPPSTMLKDLLQNRQLKPNFMWSLLG